MAKKETLARAGRGTGQTRSTRTGSPTPHLLASLLRLWASVGAGVTPR